MGDVSIVGLDIAKTVLQAHGADTSGAVVFRKKLSRSQLLAFFGALPRCVVALEACGGAHHWGRELARLGHEVRLIPPAYVKPFVKRQKNDAADAEAICEAAQQPTMRFVLVKTAEQQASGLVFRARGLLIRQRTQLTNTLEGHLFDVVVRFWVIVLTKGLGSRTLLTAKVVGDLKRAKLRITGRGYRQWLASHTALSRIRKIKVG